MGIFDPLPMRPGPFKAEYLLRPRQLALRAARALRPPAERWQVVPLPFGPALEVDTLDIIGRAVWQLGVYELTVTELLLRLAQPGERVADVGAHVGHMTAALAVRVGQQGRVVAFEPNPALATVLERNAQRCRDHAPIEVRRQAVCAATGRASFESPTGDNTGLGRIVNGGSLQVETTTLDDAFPDGAPGLIKLDVEGGELAALEGARRTLPGVRDLVFEDHHPQPSAVTRALQEAGYVVMGVRRGLLRPRLCDLRRASSAWEPPVFVASRDPARVERLLRPSGWRALGQS